jgi:hypothetical protein
MSFSLPLKVSDALSYETLLEFDLGVIDIVVIVCLV